MNIESLIRGNLSYMPLDDNTAKHVAENGAKLSKAYVPSSSLVFQLLLLAHTLYNQVNMEAIGMAYTANVHSTIAGKLSHYLLLLYLNTYSDTFWNNVMIVMTAENHFLKYLRLSYGLHMEFLIFLALLDGRILYWFRGSIRIS